MRWFSHRAARCSRGATSTCSSRRRHCEARRSRRAQAYNAYRPRFAALSGSEREAATDSRAFAGGLLLANGTTVYHPEDLLPMAGRESLTAAVTREMDGARRTGDIVLWSGLGATVLGTLIMMVGFGGAVANFHGPQYSQPWVPLILAGSALGSAGEVTMLVSTGFYGAVSRHRERSYRAYDTSLRANLGVCGAGAQAIDCDADVVAAPTARPSPPRESTTRDGGPPSP